jgi:K+/H+ antiporter YhaU regulatory subunit KhtT
VEANTQKMKAVQERSGRMQEYSSAKEETTHSVDEICGHVSGDLQN